METSSPSPLSSECEEWRGYKLPHGYGQVRFNGKTCLAHRVAYCKHYGTQLSEISGKVVRHLCDNPSCINPEHLILGSNKDNSEDMVSRNRQAKGEKIGISKLTMEKVREIRDSSDVQRVLAERYGVNQSVISNIKTGVIWNE